MTPRRLWVLLKAMPADAPFRLAVAEEMEKAKKPSDDKIRDREAYWAEVARKQQQEREAADG